MSHIELNDVKILELAALMPEEAREIFLKVLQKDINHSSVEYIKRWLGNYDYDNPIDDLLAPIIARIISKIGTSLETLVDEIKARDNSTFRGVEFLHIVIEQLNIVVNSLQMSLDNAKDKDKIPVLN